MAVRNVTTRFRIEVDGQGKLRNMGAAADKAAKEIGRLSDTVGQLAKAGDGRAKRQVDATSKAYDRLAQTYSKGARESAKFARAQKTIGAAVMSGKVSAVEGAAMMRRYGEEMERANRASQKMTKTTLSLGVAMGNFAANVVYNLVSSLARLPLTLTEINDEFTRLSRTMTAISKTSLEASESMQFVIDSTYRFGTELGGLSRQYAKFAASTKGTILEGKAGDEVFTKFGDALAVMGATAGDTSRVFNALTQMISKSRVQAEELRGQMGDVLPGAMQLAAKAMGVTTEQLDDMMKKGELMADDLLPRMAKAVENFYGKLAGPEGMTGDQLFNRMNTSIKLIAVELGKVSGVTEGWYGFLVNVDSALGGIAGWLTKISNDETFQVLAKLQTLPGIWSMISGRSTTDDSLEVFSESASARQRSQFAARPEFPFSNNADLNPPRRVGRIIGQLDSGPDRTGGAFKTVAEVEELTKATESLAAAQKKVYSSWEGMLTDNTLPKFTRALNEQTTAVEIAEQVTTSSFNNMGNAISQVATTGKLAIGDMVGSMLNDLTRLASSQIFNSMVGAMFPGGGATPAFGSVGGILSAGGVRAASSNLGGGSAFRGGFAALGARGSMASGGTVSEAGIYNVHRNERIYLPRGSQVEKAGGGGVNIVVNNNASGAQAQANETTSASGERMIEISVQDVMTRDSLTNGPGAQAYDRTRGLSMTGVTR